MLPILKEDIMTDEDFDLLKDDVIDQMVAKSKVMNKKKEEESSAQSQKNLPAASSTATATKSKKSSKAKQMLRGLNTKPKASKEPEDSDDELRDDCRAQLNRHIKDALNGA